MIKYGLVEGGVPKQHRLNQYDTWCQQLGGRFGSVTYGPRFGGSVFGCTLYDDTNWHWCDWTDGYWYNQSLQGIKPGTDSNNPSITSITCSGAIAGNKVNKYM